MRFLPAFFISLIVLAPTHRKEAAAVRVKLAGAENQRFVISIHGMRVLESNELFLAARMLAGHAVREQDTLTAPAVLDLGGLGAVDLAPLDTNASVTTELKPLMDTLRPAFTATGRRIRIEHAAFGADFTAAVPDRSRY